MKKIIILITFFVIFFINGCDIEKLKENIKQQNCERRGYFYDIWDEKCTNYTQKDCWGCAENLSRPTTGSWSVHGSFSSGCPCITAEPILANGDYICNGTIEEYSKELPEKYIWAKSIYDVDYNIDNEMLLYIANKSNLPIVCGIKNSDYGYWYERHPNPDLTGDKCDKIKEYRLIFAEDSIICCVKNYCSEWGYKIKRYNCICDDRYLRGIGNETKR